MNINTIDTRIILSGIWIALMLNNLLGDVLRIFAGDYKAGEIDGQQVGQGVWLGIAVFMLVPIIMVLLSLTLPHKANRWANMIVPIIIFIFNLLGVNTYPGVYDKFLIIVGLGINALTVWYAWKWI